MKRLAKIASTTPSPATPSWFTTPGLMRAAPSHAASGGEVLTFHVSGRTVLDGETGSRWSAAIGRAASRPQAGERLRRLPAMLPYWYAWLALHPDTAIAR